MWFSDTFKGGFLSTVKSSHFNMRGITFAGGGGQILVWEKWWVPKDLTLGFKTVDSPWNHVFLWSWIQCPRAYEAKPTFPTGCLFRDEMCPVSYPAPDFERLQQVVQASPIPLNTVSWEKKKVIILKRHDKPHCTNMSWSGNMKCHLFFAGTWLLCICNRAKQTWSKTRGELKKLSLRSTEIYDV